MKLELKRRAKRMWAAIAAAALILGGLPRTTTVQSSGHNCHPPVAASHPAVNVIPPQHHCAAQHDWGCVTIAGCAGPGAALPPVAAVTGSVWNPGLYIFPERTESRGLDPTGPPTPPPNL